ncbi:MAG: hypothetical protein KKF50_02260 [Nanoarchaeota archaeon]|nr:hypothetical protein [Nanoarchaeota archaeon]
MKKKWHRKHVKEHGGYTSYHQKKSYTWVWFLGIIILASLVYAYDVGGVKTLIEEKINQVQDNSNLGGSLLSSECPEGIVPEVMIMDNKQLTFVKNMTGIYRDYPEAVSFSSMFYWNDGVQSDLDATDDGFYYYNLCHKGQSGGENINYIYCEDLPYSKTITPVSDEGVIGKSETISYSIDLVLEEESVRTVNDMMYGDVPISSNRIISSKCKRQ